MEKKVFFQGELGKVCGVLHTVSNKSEIAIVVHGFSSNKDTSAVPISHELNKIGINALRIDLDNQGESELDFQTGASVPNYIKQVEAAINYCKSLGYKKISLIGGSFGALTVFATALTHPEIKRLVLRCPVVDYAKHAVKKYGKENLKEFEKSGIVNYYNDNKKRFDMPLDYITKSTPYSMYKYAKEVQIPVLIIQGDKDKEVSILGVKKASKLFPNANLCIIKGAGHKLDVNGDYSEGLRVMADFFKK